MLNILICWIYFSLVTINYEAAIASHSARAGSCLGFSRL